jgi:hypothetical protein
MKFLLIIILILLLLVIVSGANASADYSDTDIVNAIYQAENSEKYPYGIKSIDTHGDKEYARKICFNTVRNQRQRHADGNCPDTLRGVEHDYLTCLWHRYCPPSAHNLNKNWLKNVLYFLEKE